MNTIVLRADASYYSIGRLETNNIVINDDTVSRTHSKIIKIRDEWFYTDNSLNGSSVNGELVHNSIIKLPKTAIIRCGRAYIKIVT